MGCEPPRGASGDFVIRDFGWRLVHVNDYGRCPKARLVEFYRSTRRCGGG